ncbi:MAG TPA: hypothetical protein PLM14_05660, partial [Candidatus Hydrogenedentes bacterium]|nr:hypothetical protein [Candidatus Hydrogenedentota bacterium]
MTEVATEQVHASEAAKPVRPRRSLAELLTFPSLAIVKRETLSYMRQRRTTVWLALVVAAGMLWVLSAWPKAG